MCLRIVAYFTEFAGFVDRIADLTNANLDALRVGKQTWAKQFEEALNVNGGDLETATAFSYILHFMTFGFKASIRTSLDFHMLDTNKSSLSLYNWSFEISFICFFMVFRVYLHLSHLRQFGADGSVS